MMDMFEMKVMELLLEDGNIAFMLNGQICYVEIWRLIVLAAMVITVFFLIGNMIGEAAENKRNRDYINYLKRHQTSERYK